MYRKTYAQIDGDQLRLNVCEIKKKYANYEYYFGVVKNNAYHHGIQVINDLIAGGINYLAVSSLEEALQARKYNSLIPILCLEPVCFSSIPDCAVHNITITIDSQEYLEELIKDQYIDSLKVHLKIDSGMNRLGIKSTQELDSVIHLINKTDKLFLEGIYSHFATSGVNDAFWDSQVEQFLKITKNIDLNKIPIKHFGRSLSLVQHPKLNFCNGTRLGIILFGHSQSMLPDNSFKGKIKNYLNKKKQKKLSISATTIENDLKIKTAMSLYSEVISLREVHAGEFVGYNANYIVKDSAYIATIPIGYADGVTKNFKNVLINGKKYPIVADTMDMIMVMVDNNIKLYDKVEIFGDEITIKEVCQNINTNAYHLYSQIQNRVIRVHKNKQKIEEIQY